MITIETNTIITPESVLGPSTAGIEDRNFAPHTWQNLAPLGWSVSLHLGHFII